MTKPSKPAVLSIRNATLADVGAISTLVAKVYKEMPALTPGMLRGQIAAYPDGQFVVEYADEIVGYAAGFRVDEATAMSPHTWTQITGGAMPRGTIRWATGSTAWRCASIRTGGGCASASGCTTRGATCARRRTCAASSSAGGCPGWRGARRPIRTHGSIWTRSRRGS